MAKRTHKPRLTRKNLKLDDDVPRETLDQVAKIPAETPILVEMTKIDADPLSFMGNEIKRGEPSEPLPEIKSLSVIRVKNAWALATITTQGKKVINIEYGEPVGFRFAFEDFKLAAMREFHDKP